ncbi:RT0821/Lpp0805 family surface protein [Phreatobacter sp. AB_2022a]|uniref:RT0821/Lpp0805 family surface protein n=1 Tax=Phreatobacter sp. AB_2022a TaxID=3003134 RepID=UPI002286E2A7|nr:RT0821/Lpp0805 family surface protein [Phreatobacter sp. AB_2022a]MCZ0736115.1 RT0821/Lpp0805 family surface protein [Phreatobacter sp. AB_2022a]
MLRLAVLAVAAAGLAGCAVTLPSLWERTQTTPPASQAAPAAATAQAEPASPAARDQARSGGSGEPLRLQAYQADDAVTTGSIRRPTPQDAASQPAAGTAPIPDADWQAARRVLLEALADPADTPSLPWENAESGMRGTVTALQRANGTAGQTCRNFLGSAIKDGKEVWFDGRACRSAGAWAVLEVRPWRRG